VKKGSLLVLRNILVPLDGSTLARAALPYAEALARRSTATLTLLRVAWYRSPLGDPSIDEQCAVMDAESELASVCHRLNASGLHAVTTGVPFGGSAAAWIVEEGDRCDADLIVMATHARVGPGHWIHGSVAEQVVNRCRRPVMLVRPQDGPPASDRLLRDKPAFIVPLDGSELAEVALPVAGGLAHDLGGRVVLLGVVPGPGPLLTYRDCGRTSLEPELLQLEAESRAYLEASAAQLAPALVDVQATVGLGDPPDVIAAAAEHLSAAAVIMATHGRTGLARSVIGSVAGSTLRLVRIPTVLIHASDSLQVQEDGG
jgi:nucleotide-binding universal stress UspA family protein